MTSLQLQIFFYHFYQSIVIFSLCCCYVVILLLLRNRPFLFSCLPFFSTVSLDSRLSVNLGLLVALHTTNPVPEESWAFFLMTKIFDQNLFPNLILLSNLGLFLRVQVLNYFYPWGKVSQKNPSHSIFER